MAFRRLAAVAVAAGAGLILLAPSAAWANTTVDLKTQQIGDSADDFAEGDCDVVHGDDEDVWVFNWDGNLADVGTVVSATIEWDGPDADDDADFTANYPADGEIVGGGTPKIAFVVPADSVVVSGTSVISGTGTATGDFIVTHTCADGTPGDCEVDCEPDPCDPVTGAEVPATCTTDTTTETTPGTSTSTTPGLPKTGAALTGYLIAGAALIGGGVATLLILRRRRDAATPSL